MQRFDAKNLAAAHTQREMDMIEEPPKKVVDEGSKSVLNRSHEETTHRKDIK